MKTFPYNPGKGVDFKNLCFSLLPLFSPRPAFVSFPVSARPWTVTDPSDFGTCIIHKMRLTSKSFHVSNGHPKDCQLVRLPREGTARRHHVGQFRDIRRHLVAPTALDFAMILPAVRRKTNTRSTQKWLAFGGMQLRRLQENSTRDITTDPRTQTASYRIEPQSRPGFEKSDFFFIDD